MSSGFHRAPRMVTRDPARRYSPQRWAERLVASLDATTRELVSRDPKEATFSCFRLSLREAPALAERRGAGGWCDGLSFTEEGVLLYAPTPRSRRENFTVAHEIGHHLTDADEDDDLWDWLGDHPERGEFIEHTWTRSPVGCSFPAIVSAPPSPTADRRAVFSTNSSRLRRPLARPVRSRSPNGSAATASSSLPRPPSVN
jgi:hypothetical protein